MAQPFFYNAAPTVFLLLWYLFHRERKYASRTRRIWLLMVCIYPVVNSSPSARPPVHHIPFQRRPRGALILPCSTPIQSQTLLKKVPFQPNQLIVQHTLSCAAAKPSPHQRLTTGPKDSPHAKNTRGVTCTSSTRRSPVFDNSQPCQFVRPHQSPSPAALLPF